MEAEATTVFKVSIPQTHRDSFDYAGCASPVVIGARVWVPFHHRLRMGVVVGLGPPDGQYKQIKAIDSVIDAQPLIPAELLRLCQWVALYYQSPLSEVLLLALPKKYRLGLAPVFSKTLYYQLAMPPAMAQAILPVRARRQHDLITFMGQETRVFSKKMLLDAGFKSQQLDALKQMGLLSITEQLNKPVPRLGTPTTPLLLNEEQATAVDAIASSVGSYQCFLLQGVTGSGKTEVYLQVIAQVLQANQQILVLVPEIGLTPQLLERFSERFHEPIAVIHSNLNDTERQQAWLLAASNHVKLVIGTRAAIFTPLPTLGLIVIDEEHDASFKQMEGVRYSARDTALMRAYLRNIPIVLGSATPSLESLYNCTTEKYCRLYLKQKALSTTPLHYQILDSRNQPLQHGLAQATLVAIEEHLKQGNQVLVFINRRGFAPVLRCHGCGWIADCRACDSHLTLHRQSARLICHHCGLIEKVPFQCPTCQNRSLLPLGAGTQRIHEFLTTYFPATRLLRVDRDEVQKKAAMDECLARIHQGDVQLIIGTQMLAKGHHFPRLSLVVVLDADNGFYNHDFRALERLGQLLIQVAGRAGRATSPGHVLIQTQVPDHPMLNTLIQEGYEVFADALLATRQQACLPPFYHLAMIRAQGRHCAQVIDFLHAMKAFLNNDYLTALGPAPAPLARKAEQHRMQLLIKSASRKVLQQALTAARQHLVTNRKLANGIQWSVDVDPVDLG